MIQKNPNDSSNVLIAAWAQLGARASRAWDATVVAFAGHVPYDTARFPITRRPLPQNPRLTHPE
jgi:hypothetical protein